MGVRNVMSLIFKVAKAPVTPEKSLFVGIDYFLWELVKAMSENLSRVNGTIVLSAK